MSVSNQIAYSMAARPDKVKFIIRGLEIDRAQQVWTRMMTIVREATGWSHEYAEKHVKYNSYWYSEAINGYTFQLTYHAAACVNLLPWYFAQHLSLLEVKSYVMFRDGLGSFQSYLDDLKATKPKFSGFVKQTGRYHNKQKTGHPEHQVIGSAKAHRNGLFYVRPGEYPGLELSIEKKPLKALYTEVNGLYAGQDETRYNQQRWNALIRRVAQNMYEYYEEDCSFRGVDLSHYAQYFTRATKNNETGDVEPRYPIGEIGAQMHQADLFQLERLFDAQQDENNQAE